MGQCSGKLRKARPPALSLSQEVLFLRTSLEEMEEERRDTMILVDMMKTKIAAMEKDKEIRKFQVWDLKRRLAEVETRMPALQSKSNPSPPS